LDDYLRRLDQGDAAEVGNGGARMKNLAEKIERAPPACVRISTS
jgi:hypothetical protein